ncbi:lactate utilization protein [bacterium]|jgi:L-lactate dehydrogenase complex protein LldF|nr:lactate utilization protein [bacterium]MBT4251301.1 lactate utilization protein [bacterium]MBT4598318.1 lactate utilization protein [bacterium]MBT6754151.1 lactate utilization protein [bacterium]MBT7037971.1 lactate utilization protein [bacterium]
MTKFLKDKTKVSIQGIIANSRKKRNAVFAELGIDEECFKDEVTEIRKKTFVDFESNLNEARKNFKKRGFILHEAKKSSDIGVILKDVLNGSKTIARAKTNTGREIGLDKLLEDFESFETDLGDFIVELFSEEDQHYVLPAIHIDAEKISQKIKETFKDDIEADPTKLTHYLCEKIREKILTADTGITGANFITKNGQVVLLENEGNISLVSRLPRKHIVFVGIDKLVETVEDATKLCRAAAMFGTGQDITQYISIISGPSKTADIENELVVGAQGAKEVHIILIDNMRKEMLEKGFGDILRCINCGSCLNFCPVYHQEGNKFGGGKYIGAKGIILSAFRESLDTSNEKGCFDCMLCGGCYENCPMKIELPSMIRKVRQMQEEKGNQTKENKQMLENVNKKGNPFGEVSDKETPDKLYCC